MNTIAKIRSIIQGIINSPLRDTCYAVIDDHRFSVAPASLSYHHAYTGGLAEHTLEVLRYLNAQTVVFPNVNTDVLITAAVWHDYMKVREYVPWAPSGFEIPVPQPEWMCATDGFGKKIGHISAGAALFCTTAGERGVSRDTAEKVVHCILAHHGRREWGSPVEPQTLEALLLHQADMLSAKFGQTKEVAL
jgi:3'-5' exoribonuclease